MAITASESKESLDLFPRVAQDIDSAHPTYGKHTWNWLTVRDSIEGEAAIKSRNELYLPMPSSMSLARPVTVGGSRTFHDQNEGVYNNRMLNKTMSPNYHTNAAYSAYLQRAQFPEITSYMLRGLMGLVSKDSPVIQLPSQMEHLMEEATPTRMGLLDLFCFTVSEMLTTGRCPIVTDIDDQGRPVLVPYTAESLINWKTARPRATQENEATLCVFEEKVLQEGVFTHETRCEYAALGLVNGVYVAARYDEKGNRVGETIPQFKGKPLDFIPITVFGSINNRMNIDPSPLYSVASCALHIYMRNADLSQSEFMSCNPTLFISGISDDDAPSALGSTVAVCLPQSEAKAYYTETDTSALTHVLSHITDLYEQSIYYGAQLLDSSKKAAESAETTRLKTASTGATLSSMVKSAGKGFENHLKQMAKWIGANPDDVKFLPIVEFMTALTSQEQQALVEMWVEGAISKPTMVENFRRAGLLPEGVTVEEEIARIQADPAPSSNNSETNDED